MTYDFVKLTGGKMTLSEAKAIKFYKEKVLLNDPHQWAVHPSASDVTQFRVDIDLKHRFPFDEEVKKVSLYTQNQLRSAIILTQNLLKKRLCLKDDELLVAVMEKKAYQPDPALSIWKNGIHFQFPEIWMRNDEMRLVANSVQDELKKVFKGDDYKPDYGYTNNAWLLLNGSKEQGKEPYRVTAWYDAKDACFIPDDEVAEILWIIDNKREPKRTVSIKELMKKTVEEEDGDDWGDLDEGEIEEIKGMEIVELLDQLPQECVEHTGTWWGVVQAIKNHLTSEGVDQEKIREIARMWSKRTKMGNFTESGLEAVLESTSSYSIRTIYRHIREARRLIRLCLDGSDEAFAEAIYIENEGNIWVTSSSEGFIYNEEGLKWDRVERFQLYDRKVDRLKEILEEEKRALYKRMEKIEDKEVIKVLNAKLKLIGKRMEKLKSDSTEAKVANRLRKFCYDPKFEEKVDDPMNEWLFLRGGKAYNMRTGEVRDRVKDDNCSFILDVELTDETPLADEYISGMGFDDGGATLLKMSAYLFTSLHLKLFQIWTGIADSGKSTYLNFLRAILGKFASGVSPRVFEKQKSVHDTELLDAVTKRKLTMMVEKSKEEPIDGEIIKRLVGNDGQQLRRCNGRSSIETEITSKFVIAMNGKPNISKSPDVIKKVIYCEFKGQFTPEQVKRMKEVTGRPEFLSQLFTKIIRLTPELYANPVLTSSADAKFKLANVAEWLDETCEIEKVAKGKESEFRYSSVEAYNSYKHWCSTNQQKEEDVEVFRNEMLKATGGELKKLRYTDYRGVKGQGKCFTKVRREVLEEERLMKSVQDIM